MLEHLDPEREVSRFLAEVRRVLASGSILRLVLPDLLRCTRNYLEGSRDADEFLRSLHLADGTPRGFVAVARHLIGGFRVHRWMYDAASLIRLLERHGFSSIRELSPDETTIPEPGPLDLRERQHESIYVEAQRA